MADADLIANMAAAKTAHDIIGILNGASAVDIAVDAIDYVMNGDYKNNCEKACILEFCMRNGGVTLDNARRFFPVFKQRTNRCGECRLPGHQKPACNRKLKKLAEEWGIE